MKQVVRNMPSQQRYLIPSQASTQKFYGVHFAVKTKGFVTCMADYAHIYSTPVPKATFFIVTTTALTNPFVFRQYSKNSLEDCILEAINYSHEVFEFDDYKSLFEWLIE